MFATNQLKKIFTFVKIIIVTSTSGVTKTSVSQYYHNYRRKLCERGI
jgi:hypothetical protein